MRALGDLGYAVVGLDTDPQEVMKAQCGLLRRIQGKLYRLGWECNSPGNDLAGINIKILGNFRNSTCDILWIDKGLTILREILQSAKSFSQNAPSLVIPRTTWQCDTTSPPNF